MCVCVCVCVCVCARACVHACVCMGVHGGGDGGPRACVGVERVWKALCGSIATSLHSMSTVPHTRIRRFKSQQCLVLRAKDTIDSRLTSPYLTLPGWQTLWENFSPGLQTDHSWIQPISQRDGVLTVLKERARYSDLLLPHLSSSMTKTPKRSSVSTQPCSVFHRRGQTAS